MTTMPNHDPHNLRHAPDPDGGRLPWQERAPDESATSLARRIRGMLVGDEFEYAEETLSGILATLEETGRCTSRQVDAVDNIAAKPRRRPTPWDRKRGW